MCGTPVISRRVEGMALFVGVSPIGPAADRVATPLGAPMTFTTDWRGVGWINEG